MSVPDVHILVTCREESLKKFSLLVFDTIRVGFPTAKIIVYDNDLNTDVRDEVLAACLENGYEYKNVDTIHHEWITDICIKNQCGKPFWIVDTDIVFYSKVEDWEFKTPLAGYRMPEFDDEFTGAITRARLHTSLMYIDPVILAAEIDGYLSQFPETPFNPKASFIDPLCIPFSGRGIFYDTMAMAYQAVGGTEFTPKQKDAYFHMHYGTLSDMVLPRLTNGEEIGRVRDSILANPELGRGLWRVQDEYLNGRRPNLDGKDVIAPITPQDSKDAREWNFELCKGNPDAMAFCDLWYGYVHGIDDLIDTSKDGRPSMSKNQMIRLFFHAAILYNTVFYRQNQAMLFPLILDITNAYKMSVKWEASSKSHLRYMADIFRTCGNRMYEIVALICGGEEHQEAMSERINERDFLGQHDKDGNPI